MQAMSFLSRSSSTSHRSWAASEDSAVILSSLVRKRLVRPGLWAKTGAWAQRQLELHANPLALLWFEPSLSEAEEGPSSLRGTLPLDAAARVEPHPGTSPNHRRQLRVVSASGDGHVLRVECASADERDAWVGAIDRALAARAASASDAAVAALYEAFPDVETALIGEVRACSI